MKNLTKLFGIIAIMTVIGFAMAGCGDPANSGSSSKSLTGISVTTPPTKVQYNLNEELDLTGMVVTATYDDGSTEAVTGYTLSGYDKTAAGHQTITVTYKEKTDSFLVLVIDPNLPSAAQPTASPAAGVVAGGTMVTLSTTTDGAEIWYTTNGTTPVKGGSGSTKYAAPIAITAAVSIKAIAVKDGMNDSTVLEAAYTIQAENPSTPAADDFIIGNLDQMVTNITAVTITPKAGKSNGAITIYYNGSTTLPTTAGTYTVTFDVAAVFGWNAATGLTAGTLTINQKADTVGVQFTGFGNEIINLTLSDGNDIPSGQEFTVTVDGDWDYYRWYLDGNQNPGGQNMNTYTVGDWLGIGIHTVTAVVTKNNVHYSKEVIFRVVR